MRNSFRIILYEETYSVLKAVKCFYVTLIIMIYFTTTGTIFFFLKKDLFSTPKTTYHVTEKQLLTIHFWRTKPPPLYKTKYTFKSSFKKKALKNLSSSIGRKHAIKTSLTLLSVLALKWPIKCLSSPFCIVTFLILKSSLGVMADH